MHSRLCFSTHRLSLLFRRRQSPSRRSPAMELEFGVRTDKGKVRAKNGDAYYVDPLKGLFMVADGLGGHQAGEVVRRG
jgi:serine/threonine protein phosphatase PrpC